MERKEHIDKKWNFPFVEYSFGDMSKPMPLVVQLHGSGERGVAKEELRKVDVNCFSDYLMNSNHECLVVMPQCPPDSFWAAKVETILSFIGQLTEEYNVDKDRIYLTGLSMGGYGTWYTAMAKPDMFAAIAPVCGGGMAWNAGVLSMPIWVFHGAEDDVVSVIQSDEMVAKLKEFNSNVRYTRLDGVGHNVWEQAYTKELFEWLLSNNLRNMLRRR